MSWEAELPPSPVNSTCALTSGGVAKCWGDNGNGQLGDGTITDRTNPVNVTGLGSSVTTIVAGDFHTCALTTGGGIKCWGGNRDGRLGEDHPCLIPVDVSGLGSGVAAIATGYSHTCALRQVAGSSAGGAILTANWETGRAQIA